MSTLRNNSFFIFFSIMFFIKLGTGMSQSPNYSESNEVDITW